MNAFSSSTATTVSVESSAAALLMMVAVDQKLKKPRRRMFFKIMDSSSFNIQYQSTGVGSLSSLDEIQLVRSL